MFGRALPSIDKKTGTKFYIDIFSPNISHVRMVVRMTTPENATVAFESLRKLRTNSREIPGTSTSLRLALLAGGSIQKI